MPTLSFQFSGPAASQIIVAEKLRAIPTETSKLQNSYPSQLRNISILKFQRRRSLIFGRNTSRSPVLIPGESRREPKLIEASKIEGPAQSRNVDAIES
jgi:hypothetical protein